MRSRATLDTRRETGVPSASPGAVTELLKRAGAGNQAAFDALFPLVYAELCRVAAREMRHEKQGRTLQTTALVHEAYLRLLKDASLSFESRAHFLGIAARAMREILIERARARVAQKRGGQAVRITLDDVTARTPAPSVDVLALDEALQRLARVDERHARVIELRYFGGLSVEETAVAMDLSPATVKRAWTLARAWLFRELTGSVPSATA
jgi:RNA polymerase sigma factor (TIGR02999 family)